MEAKYHYKFRIVLKNSYKDLYARSEKERKVWIRTFCRVLDVNNGMTGPFTGFSPAYNKVKERYKYSLMRAAKAAKGIATQRRMGNFDFDSIYKFTSA